MIYIPIWLDLLSTEKADYMRLQEEFTFQYGQIYYKFQKLKKREEVIIYIPIWLDLLFLNKFSLSLN